MSNMRDILGQPGTAASTNWPQQQPGTGRLPLLSAQTLRQAALKLADLRRGASSLHTKDLVGLLVCHAARSRRAHQPRALIHLSTAANVDRLPVRLHIG